MEIIKNNTYKIQIEMNKSKSIQIINQIKT